MCRLFGLTAAPNRVHTRFWLLEAPDSLSQQSRKNADGTGLGIFNAEGVPVLDKQPIAAYEDIAFAGEARRPTTAPSATCRSWSSSWVTIWRWCRATPTPSGCSR
jgi:predicted glutamine amidotransferase